MNCCNDFGQCTQGFNCPVREKPWPVEEQPDGTVIPVDPTSLTTDQVVAMDETAEYAMKHFTPKAGE